MGKTSVDPAMEIGEAAVAALTECSKASSRQIEALAGAVMAVVLGLEREEKALAGAVVGEMDEGFISKAYNALLCLFLEAAKLDLAYADVLSFLRSECEFSEKLGEIVSQLFADRKEALRALISRTACQSYVPQLLGAEWRLDYCVSSSEDRAMRELLYHVSINTFDGVEGAEKKVNFQCSVEELQDLVARLKDACKSVERTLQLQ